MLFVPIKTKKITNNIFSIRALMVNLFVIRDGDNMICIDTGFAPRMVQMGLKKLDINPLFVNKIFLTHSDYDHAGGLDLFPNAEIHLSVNEEQMINGMTARNGKTKFNNPITRKYTLLKDQQEISLGNLVVKGISAPGHTPGSMAYLVNGEYLFVGDSMALTNGKVHTFPGFINMNTKVQEETIRRLAGLTGVKMMFTAHSGYTCDYGKAVGKWR